MSIDPATAQSWANVFGGGLSGVVIAMLVGANMVQFALNRRDRERWDEEREAVAKRHAEAFESIRKAADARNERSLVVSERLLMVIEEFGRRAQRKQAQPAKGGV